MSVTAVLAQANWAIASLAQATAPATGPAPATAPVPATGPAAPVPAPGWMEMLRQFFPFLILIAVMYVFIFRSKRNQDRQRQTMLSEMKRGDRVQTIGGVLGSVVETREDRILLKVDESSNTKIWFARSAIHRVVADDKAEAK